MTSGIYKIVNIITNDCYIGSSVNINKRKNQHFNLLKHKEHHSIYLQNAYNKYGKDNFIFNILELCEKDKCIEREQWFIDNINSKYNMSKTVINSNYGSKHKLNRKKPVYKKSIKGLYNKVTNKNIYKFIHIDGEVVNSTPYEFYTFKNLKKSAVNNLVLGKNRSVKGWYIDYIKPKTRKFSPKKEINMNSIYYDLINGMKKKEIILKYNISYNTLTRRLKYLDINKINNE